jgi:cytochrome P450
MAFNYELLLIAADDPYPTYRWMRDEDPAHYSEIEDIWVLTRYDDCAAAFGDWQIWSSQRRGNLVNDIPARVGKTLGTIDPPRHTFFRKLVNKAFTPRVIAKLEPTIRSLAQRCSAEAREKGTIEFTADISAPYNAVILGAMFGVPEAEFIRLRHWLDDFFLREKPQEGQEPKQVVAMRKLREYLDVLAEKRYQQPEDDLMTAMLMAEEEGLRMEQEQVVVTSMTFLTAGFESVNNLFTNLAYALDRHPQVWAEIKQDPQLIPAFIEEGMRWDAPAQGFVRSPTREVVLHGKAIPEGSQVLLHIGAADRDERRFEDPDRFDLYREDNRHLALGHRTHFCIGAPLGQLMTRILFEELLAVSERWEIDLDNAERVTTPNFRGFARLPLTI